MGSIMWAASGLVGIMLPGVAVTFNPMFPELMAVLLAPILFCGLQQVDFGAASMLRIVSQ